MRNPGIKSVWPHVAFILGILTLLLLVHIPPRWIKAALLLLLVDGALAARPGAGRAGSAHAEAAKHPLKQEASAQSVPRIMLAFEAICAIGPQSSVAEVRQTVVGATCDALDTAHAALFTIDPFTGEVECDGTDSISDTIRTAFLDLYDNRLTDRDAREVWVLDDLAARDFGHEEALRTIREAGFGAMAACPVRSEVSASGALVVLYPSGSKPVDEQTAVIEALAAQASMAISYALAMEQSRELLEDLVGANQELSLQATSDGLTGLANHRSFQQMLAELCHKSAGRNDCVFSLAMADVDHFKFYNDTYGHREGDAVLRKVAKTLSSSLRQGDMAARYGGEEFTIIFRNAGKEAAFGAADRIRRSIAQQSFRKGAVTVSIGLAEFPFDASTPQELIEQADRALYHAKVTGRNRVYVWGSGSRAEESETVAADVDELQRSVLMVEPPEDESAAEIAQMLRGRSCRVEPAASPTDAMELLKTSAFDIAFVSLDVLPEGDLKPLTALAAIHPNMPIVLVASNLEIEESREALRRGASDILTKPWNADELPLVIERNLERRKLELQRMMQKSTGVLLQAIDALVAAIDAKDPFTAGHSERVTELALAMSEHLSLSNEERYALELAAKLHDIGKLALPDSSLNKDSPLTEEEWHAMRDHPVLGARIVGAIDELAYVSTIIRHHHERLDGTGYPDGLRGPAIPNLSRIIAVADAYEAMTSERAHRSRLTPAEAFEEIECRAGRHYTPEIVEVLRDHLVAQGAIRAAGRSKAA